MELIKDFNKRYGITVLMVTHNPDQVHYASRVVKMVDGQIDSSLTSEEEINKIKNEA